MQIKKCNGRLRMTQCVSFSLWVEVAVTQGRARPGARNPELAVGRGGSECPWSPGRVWVLINQEQKPNPQQSSRAGGGHCT